MTTSSPATPEKLDPITFEVLRHKLDEIIAEAYYTMGRVSGSPVVYEVGDHQEAICTASGEAAVFGAGVLHWVQAIGAGVRNLIDRYSDNPGFNEDDQFLVNDPYIAASHGMDIQLLAPVIWEGELIAWAGSASHQTDIGGINPGSLCISATEVFQEGFLTPGLKIVERGVVRKDIEDTFRNAVRTPDLGLLDIRAKIASNNVMKTRLGEMLDRYGPDTVKTLFAQLIDYSEQRLRARLRKIPDGTWRSANWVEGIKEDHLKVELAMTKSGDTVKFDFTGSSPQSQSALNMSKVGTMGSAANGFIAMVCSDIPWNEGLFRPLEFELPEGSVVNPRRPAPVSASVPTGGSVLVLTTSQNAISKMLLASETLRNESCGNSAAGHNTLVLVGQDASGHFFTTLVLDAIAGGGGGFPDRDGESTAQSQWTVKTMIANVETTEMLYPVLYLWRSEVTDSGGPGENRGGLGIEAALIPWGTDHMININIGCGLTVRNCLGYAGGYPASHTPVRVMRGADVQGSLFANGVMPSTAEQLRGELETVASKSQSLIQAGDVVYGYLGSGGGGYGDPLEREPERVLADVAMRAVSPEAAREAYGVVIDGSAVDADATERERERIRRERLDRMTASDAPVEPGLSCPRCGGGQSAGLGTFDAPSTSFEPEAMHPPEDTFVLRHQCCAGCGTLFEVSVAPSPAA
ncbi:MAG: N-methylhydantoinase [Thermoleophilaceae bacterium]|jgi:N-methylhydantoinase B|nr:N-methylhydantoinase [Thermoleophilaceae bacterium]